LGSSLTSPSNVTMFPGSTYLPRSKRYILVCIHV
jgi:hypothetical protein